MRRHIAAPHRVIPDAPAAPFKSLYLKRPNTPSEPDIFARGLFRYSTKVSKELKAGCPRCGFYGECSAYVARDTEWTSAEIGMRDNVPACNMGKEFAIEIAASLWSTTRPTGGPKMEPPKKVFLCWSKDRSKAIAEGWAKLLPEIVSGKPILSTEFQKGRE